MILSAASGPFLVPGGAQGSVRPRPTVRPVRPVRHAVLLVAALLAAGCADDPEPVTPGEPTFSDADVPLGAPLAPMTWTTIHEGRFALAPASPYPAGITIPPDTLQILVNFTLEAGGTTNLWLTLGECSWRTDAPVVMGQTFGADCGGLTPAQAQIFVAVDSGALAGGIAVIALTCDPHQGRCPAPAPVTKE